MRLCAGSGDAPTCLGRAAGMVQASDSKGGMRSLGSVLAASMGHGCVRVAGDVVVAVEGEVALERAGEPKKTEENVCLSVVSTPAEVNGQGLW